MVYAKGRILGKSSPTTTSQIAAQKDEGQAWTPLSPGNCELWLRADAITGLSDGDDVPTWEDCSGQGNDFTGAVAKPTYETNAMNGRPVVRFVRANADEFTMVNPNWGPGDYTVIVALDLVSTPSNTLLCRETVASNHFSLYLSTAAGPGYRVEGGGYELGGSNSTAREVFTWVLEAPNKGRTYRSGTPIMGPSTYAATSVNDNMRFSPGASGVDGDIAEILIYSKALSNSERGSVENYLGNKYNITIA